MNVVSDTLKPSAYKLRIHELAKNIQQRVSHLKMAVFWDVAPCSLVDIDQRFRED
jgi:hypothetical protein